MKRVVLPFEKEVISKDEIKEHMTWYLSKLRKAQKQKDIKEQTNILRSVRETLNSEAKHYRKSKVEESYNIQSDYSRPYCETIVEIDNNSNNLNRTVSQIIDELISEFQYYETLYAPS